MRSQRSPWLPLAELRSPLEFAGTLAALPFLAAAPRGDGHTTIVLPGWLASDASTLTLRAFLRARGFRAQGWGVGRNPGTDPALLAELVSRTRTACEKGGRPVSLVGWSLGGVYAREIARRVPDTVRCVVSLGSPIQRDPRSRHAPPVPSTALFSVSDAIVPPRWARESEGARTESIEVPASHLGLGHNPFVLHAIGDRLNQGPAKWRAFEPGPLARLFYRGDGGA